ncbi:sel1 repeat family protein [Lysobacter antibioticus]|uniref:Sel1 repeat family protein n=1 Tax=Lysobacter antibioticus TaxID=84531 RepID=A0A0S2F428_LYSAN|nr:sel1 repeat family protein [Lysobacter antibioticus]ALN78275.1 hypothetical protein LA76x_0113 [Lysobacter antibioticus]
MTGRLIFCLFAASLAMGSASAATQAPIGPDPAADAALADVGYMHLHPDVEYRQLGLQSYRRGHHAVALDHFRRAGYFGDKPAQGLVAEMYWKGEGVAADRALAYVWMDLAAERGYRDLVGLRERYWAALSAAERQRALEQGAALYRVYGDPTVKPRYARRLQRLRNQITGSHIGTDVGVLAGQRDASGSVALTGGLYADANWNAEQYWQRQDRLWKLKLGGTVNVGDVEAMNPEGAVLSPPAESAPEDRTEPKVPPRPR